jgi:hypothetical protein
VKNGVMGNLADPVAANSEVAENMTFREQADIGQQMSVSRYLSRRGAETKVNECLGLLSATDQRTR